MKLEEIQYNTTYKDQIELNFVKNWQKSLKMHNYMGQIYKEIEKEDSSQVPEEYVDFEKKD